MTATTNVAKAELWKLDENAEAVTKFKVQFNPDSLKVTYTNQIQPPAQSATDGRGGTSAMQYVGHGSSKLAVTLWFDVSAELPSEGSAPNGDVRDLTNKVIDLINVDLSRTRGDQPVPPAVRFVWGSFQFDGLIESIDQTLEFFSPEGIPLRASLGLSLTRQSTDYAFPQNRPRGTPRGAAASLPSGAAPGTSPMTPAASGSTLQGMAAAQGKFDNWQAIAEANGIENPRLLAPGQLIDMNARGPASINIPAPVQPPGGFDFRQSN